MQAAPIIVLNTPNWKPRNNHFQNDDESKWIETGIFKTFGG